MVPPIYETFRGVGIPQQEGFNSQYRLGVYLITQSLRDTPITMPGSGGRGHIFLSEIRALLLEYRQMEI